MPTGRLTSYISGSGGGGGNLPLIFCACPEIHVRSIPLFSPRNLCTPTLPGPKTFLGMRKSPLVLTCVLYMCSVRDTRQFQQVVFASVVCVNRSKIRRAVLYRDARSLNPTEKAVCVAVHSENAIYVGGKMESLNTKLAHTLITLLLAKLQKGGTDGTTYRESSEKCRNEARFSFRDLPH